MSWFDHACAYVEMKWPRAAAKTRKSMAEAMTSVMMALLSSSRRGRPADDKVREALYGWAFNPARRADGVPADVADVLRWVGKSSMRVSALQEAVVVRRVLDALSLRLDGTAAAATTIYRKRAVFYNALGYAVELNLLPSNPVDKVQWTAPEIGEAVDRRVVASPAQVESILACLPSAGLRGGHLVAFFGCMYYAGMRPSEVVALTADNCVDLPDTGWGHLELTGSTPRAGKLWTNDGDARESRELKRRSVSTVRPVPIPPRLVGLVRRHLEVYGTGAAGRLFRSGQDGPLQESTYRQVWAKARSLALENQSRLEASPMARRPYDLRHAAASLWLNAGVPATEVARRLGHSVAVLLKVYANCIDGQEDTVNQRIDAALSVGCGTLAHDGAPSGTASKTAGQVRDAEGQTDASGPKTQSGGLA